MRRVAILTALPVLALAAASFVQAASAHSRGLAARSASHALIRIDTN